MAPHQAATGPYRRYPRRNSAGQRIDGGEARTRAPPSIAYWQFDTLTVLGVPPVANPAPA